VTTGQRARLILSFGVLNIVLATIALGIGGVELQQRAAASGGPSQIAVIATPTPSAGSTPTAETTPSTPAGEPSSQPQPSVTASTTPSGSTATPSPSTTPSGIVVSPSPTSGLASTPAVATPATPANPTAAPTAAPTPQRTARPTARPTPAATPRPTPKPTAKPTPKPTVAAGGNAKAHPPCPNKGGSPPGHAKTDGPHKACGKGKDKGNGGKNGGIVLILPLLATSVAWAVRPERLRPRRRAR
jgi:hypothetical protein